MRGITAPQLELDENWTYVGIRQNRMWPEHEGRGFGDPDLGHCETTYVERLNDSLRLSMKRMNRKAYAFSKKWANLHAALALQCAHYNFVRSHALSRKHQRCELGLTRCRGVSRAWLGRLYEIHAVFSHYQLSHTR